MKKRTIACLSWYPADEKNVDRIISAKPQMRCRSKVVRQALEFYADALEITPGWN